MSEKIHLKSNRRGISRRDLFKAAAVVSSAFSLPKIYAQTTGDLADLYSAAKQEGALTYYAGGPTAPHQAAIDQFSNSYPGIKVSLATGFSNQLVPRIDEQIARGSVETDVANLQTIQDIERWKNRGALIVNRGPNFDEVLDQFKDADGTNVGVRVYALGYGYNQDMVSADQIPKSAVDFLKPKFRGQVVSSYPHDDDITLYLYYNIVQAHGWKFMPELMANKPQFIRGHVGVVREMAQGRAGLSFDTSIETALASKRSGSRIEVVAPTDDLMTVWENRCCIFKGAPHPNAARLFVAWLISYEHQSRQGNWSTRRDVAAVGSFKSISNYKTADHFRDFILDEPRVVDMRKRFASYIGPVFGEVVLAQ